MLTIATVKNSKLNNYCTSCCTVKFYFFLVKVGTFSSTLFGSNLTCFQVLMYETYIFLSELLTFKTSRALKVTFIVYAQKYIVNELNKSNKTVNLLT